MEQSIVRNAERRLKENKVRSMKKQKWMFIGLFVVLTLIGIGMVRVGQPTVYAEESDKLYLAPEGNFVAEYVGDIATYRGNTNLAPKATTQGYEDWLFAGWYEEKTCVQQNAMSKHVFSGPAWAKYVPADVLSVKCQVKADVLDAGVDKTNMRLISSVDSLAYSNVGFDIKYRSDGTVIRSSMQTVYERIKSSAKSSVEFQHNPKIVEADSKYFVTATLINILQKNYDEIFLIKPYWITLDGTMVYGESRYVKVSDSYSEVVNIPVKTSSKSAIENLTVENKNVQERRYFEEEDFGALLVEEQDVSALPSASQYNVSDGSSMIFRNIYANYAGTADQTWYQFAERDKYVLTGLADLYGFAGLVNGGNDFSGKTVYLGTDVVANEGNSIEWKTKTPANIWTPIGSKEAPFNGVFDGYLDGISGLYVAGGVNSGLFGYVEKDATVQNLEVKNSCYTSDSTTQTLGSVVGYLRGDAVRLFVADDVYLSNKRTGGLNQKWGTGGVIGIFEREGVSTPGTISECWFAGEAESSRASVSGILGHAYRGTLNFENCLNTGTIRSTHQSGDGYVYASGLIGGCRSWNGATGLYANLSNCLNLGSITVTGQLGVGSVVGRSLQSTVTLKNVYTTDEVTNTEKETINTDGTITGFGNYSLTAGVLSGMVVKLDDAEIFGKKGYVSLDLDYYSSDNKNGVWAAISGKTPELKAFSEESVISDFDGTDRELTGWYYNGFTYSCVGYTNPDGTTIYPHVNTQTTYKVSNADELRGLRKLVNEGIDDFADVVYEKPEKTISGRKVVLTDDIIVYKGKATDWANGKNLPMTTWKPIGLNDESQKFSGIFDGQGHSIDGVYAVDTKKVEGELNYLGLFAITSPTSTIKNVRLTNSYFNQKVTDGLVGSIACDIQGVAESIYSDAIIDSHGQQTGGLIARANGLEYEVSGTAEDGDLVMGRGSMSMNNCWFDGKIRIRSVTSSSNYIGGVAGVVVQGTANISNSLFTGSIESITSSKTLYIGGLVGSAMAQSSIGYQEGSESKLNLSSCISAGSIQAPSGFRGATMGRVVNGISGGKANNTYVNLTNIFATRDCWQVAINTKSNMVSGEVTAVASVTGRTIQTYNTDRLIGYCTEESTKEKLDFANTWSMRVSGVPIPKTLRDMVGESALIDVSALTKEIGLDYWNGTLEKAVNYGVGNYVTSYSATKDTYQAYLKKLEGLGFVKYVDNSASTMDDDGVYNVIYTKDKGDWVLHITYVDKEGKIYISINTMGKEKLDDNLISAKQEGSADVMFSMLQLVNTSGYGNGFLFQLPNGHFIVIDGGTSADGPMLVKYLKALAGNGPVYIDAWVISHFHGDHSAGFNQLATNASLREGIYLEAVYANESSNYSKCSDGSANIAPIDNAYLAAMSMTKADGSRPDVVRMHMGERYYFNGVTMDVIQAQEQLPVDSYNDFSDPDKYNATSTNCIFTINATGDKIFTGGDSTKANMNYIMKAYDGETTIVKRYNAGNGWYTDTDPAEITRTRAETFQDISVFIAYHHGKNTTNAFTRYLVGEADDEYTFDIALFPFHQMMNPTLYETYVYNGTTYKNRYWMEDNSCVFNYKMGEVNESLLANVTQGFYTYGYEDSVSGSSATNMHGTVELKFTSGGIKVNVLKSWKNGFTMETFE